MLSHNARTLRHPPTHPPWAPCRTTPPPSSACSSSTRRWRLRWGWDGADGMRKMRERVLRVLRYDVIRYDVMRYDGCYDGLPVRLVSSLCWLRMPRAAAHAGGGSGGEAHRADGGLGGRHRAQGAHRRAGRGEGLGFRVWGRGGSMVCLGVARSTEVACVCGRPQTGLHHGRQLPTLQVGLPVKCDPSPQSHTLPTRPSHPHAAAGAAGCAGLCARGACGGAGHPSAHLACVPLARMHVS